MKLDVASNVIASSGLQKTSQFQIRTSAHAFKLLSSGLYSDKLGAVLREIGCNAADAHVAAGCPDRPFEVHMPTRLVQKFYIRDFGLGMSEQDIIDLYTTYFSSSKSQSNEFTGAFGLGSKSPFAYTDRFTVTSFHGGKKITYAAFVGADGAPNISKVSELPLDAGEETGLMVSMPVKPDDYYELQRKARTIFRWFKVPPVMLNEQPIQAVKFTAEGSGWAIIKRNTESGVSDRAVVVMGNVAYPIPNEVLRERSIEYWLNSFVPVIRLAIGGADVAASREQLEVTPRTKQSVLSILDAAVQESTKHMVAVVNSLSFSTVAEIKNAHEKMKSIGYEMWKLIQSTNRLDATLIKNVDRVLGDADSWPPPKATHGILCSVFNIRATKDGKGICVSREGKAVDFARQWRVHLDKDIRILKHSNAKYIRDRLTTLPLHTKLIRPNDENVDVEQFAKDMFNFPVLDPGSLPLPANFVKPSKRPKKGPRPKKVHYAQVLLDSSGKEEERAIFDDATNPHHYVFRYTAWGVQKFTSGGMSVTPTEILRWASKFAPHVSGMPDHIVLLTQGEYDRHELMKKPNWLPLLDTLRVRMIEQSVKDKVCVVNATEVPMMFDRDGNVMGAQSMMGYLACHCANKTKLWKTLVPLLPSSPIMAAAECAAKKGKIEASNPNTPIEAQDYNNFVWTLGERAAQIDYKTAQNEWSEKCRTAEGLLDSIRTGYKGRDPVVLANMLAIAIKYDEEGLVPDLKFQKLAA